MLSGLGAPNAVAAHVRHQSERRRSDHARTSCGSTPRRASRRTRTTSPASIRNLNAGIRPSGPTLRPERPGNRFSLNQDSGNGRVTWQSRSDKHKVTGFYDQQRRPWNDLRPGATSRAASWWRFPRLRTTQAGWTSPMTSRLLLEARWSNRGEILRRRLSKGHDPRRDLIAVLRTGRQHPGPRLSRSRWRGLVDRRPSTRNYMPNLNTRAVQRLVRDRLPTPLKFGVSRHVGLSGLATIKRHSGGRRLPVQQRRSRT